MNCTINLRFAVSLEHPNTHFQLDDGRETKLYSYTLDNQLALRILD